MRRAPIGASIVGPLLVATRITASIAACPLRCNRPPEFRDVGAGILSVTRFAAAGQRDWLIKISGSSVKPVEKRGLAQWHRVLVACAAASMRYHDEIRVFSRLVAKSVVGNNQ